MKKILYLLMIILITSCSTKNKETLLNSVNESNSKTIEILSYLSEYDKISFSRLYQKTPTNCEKFKGFVDTCNLLIDYIDELCIENMNTNKKISVDEIINSVEALNSFCDTSLISDKNIFKELTDISIISRKLSNRKNNQNLVYLQMIQKRLLIFKSKYLADIIAQVGSKREYRAEYIAIARTDRIIYNLGDTVKTQISPVYATLYLNTRFDMDGVDVENNGDGYGYFKFKPTKKGMQSKKFNIILKNRRTGEELFYSNSIEYYVY